MVTRCWVVKLAADHADAQTLSLQDIHLQLSVLLFQAIMMWFVTVSQDMLELSAMFAITTTSEILRNPVVNATYVTAQIT
jgi:hypothetical protein